MGGKRKSSKGKANAKGVTKLKERDAPDPGLIIDGPHSRKPSAAACAARTGTVDIIGPTDNPRKSVMELDEDFVDDRCMPTLDDTDMIVESSFGESSPLPVVPMAVVKKTKVHAMTVQDKNDIERAELKQGALCFSLQDIYVT